MNKKIKSFLFLIFFLFTAQFIYASNSFEVLKSSTIPAGSSFSDNTDSYGIYFTTTTLDYAVLSLEGDITVSKNKKGIYCGNYGTLALQNLTYDNITIYTSSNGRVGIQSQYIKDCYQSTTISISDINIRSDYDTIGLFTCGKMYIESTNINNKKTIYITNSSTAAIQVNAGGTFHCKNMDITGNADKFFLLTGKTSSTTFENTNINIDAQEGFVSQKDDRIYFINSSFKNEKEHFLTSEEKDFFSYKTEITANHSTIEGYIDNQSNKVYLNLENNSVWKMKKNSIADELVLKNSKIDLSSSKKTTFNTLTVSKLTGTGTTNEIILNTQLNGDDSLTDKLVITTKISGNFILNINNVGGKGAVTQKGIKIVDVTVKNAPDTFTLKNSKIDIGAYVYTLHQGTTDDVYSWFLKSSSSQKADSFVTVSNTPQFINFALKTGMNELSKRLGDIRRTPLTKYNGVWARTYGKNFSYDKGLKTELNIFGVEAGYDFRINKTTSYVVEEDEGYDKVVEGINENRYYLGFTAGFQNIGKIETEHKTSNKNGTGSGNSKSIGIYGSYIAQNGLFVDLTLRNFWFDFDMKTYSSSDEQIYFKPQTTQTALSLETGKEFLFGKNVIFEPKVELLFAYNSEITVTASNNNEIKYASNILCNGKLGFMFGLLNNKSKPKSWLPYLEASYNYDFNNKTDITYSDTTETADFSGGYFDIGVGLNAYFGKGISGYCLVSYETGSDQNNIAYNIGIRYGF